MRKRKRIHCWLYFGAGIAGTVFAAEFYRTRSAGQGARAAVFAAVRVLGSAVVQSVVTLLLLVRFVLVAV